MTKSTDEAPAQQLYVLGHPVAHSKSPAMHNAALQALGLPWTYDFMDCPTEDEALAFLQRPDWLAINITMPYKPHAFGAAAFASDEARLAQGANVLIRTPQGLYAHNTDGIGCVTYLQREGVDFQDASVVVCGTGPTSQAIMHAALKAGARSVRLLGRRAQKTTAATNDYLARLGVINPDDAHRFAPVLASGSYEGEGEAIRSADIIIDATPLGMNPEDGTPFDPSLLCPGQAVFDVVYGHGVTPLLKAAAAKGCLTFDGSGMLVAQAVETLYAIEDTLNLPLGTRSLDLFPLMASAGFPELIF